jgi:hypothetical protein|tara:strand:+ start:1522 stop:1650 length:129 start_codon:yes stop_codon:yes gene_type:complete
MEMLDRFILKICGWIDDQFQKVEDVLTFKFCSCKKKKKSEKK